MWFNKLKFAIFETTGTNGTGTGGNVVDLVYFDQTGGYNVAINDVSSVHRDSYGVQNV